MFFNDDALMEKNVSRERVYDGIILHIDHLVNELPNGKLAKREVAVHVGASAVLPIDEDGNTYLVRQYRIPLDKVLLEIPAGKLDSFGEDRLEAAKRELKEETGLEAKEWTLLNDMYSSAGFTNEMISIYMARDLTFGESRPDEDEFLNIVKMPVEEAYNMVVRGEIRDSKTIAALCIAKARLSEK